MTHGKEVNKNNKQFLLPVGPVMKVIVCNIVWEFAWKNQDSSKFQGQCCEAGTFWPASGSWDYEITSAAAPTVG